MIQVSCEGCGAKLRCRDELAGRKGRCPKCGTVFEVPAAAAVTMEVVEVASAMPEAPAPPPVPPFLRDLRLLYASIRPIDPAEYLGALEACFRERRLAKATRLGRFRDDLSKVYALIVSTRAESHLTALSEKFELARQACRARMGEKFARLPEDDPLRCPISLFGIIDQGRLETAHTRALAWVLDPRREHGFGNLFICDILRKLDDDGRVHDVLVEECAAEFQVVDGRIDVLIQGTARPSDQPLASWSWLLMIEAKIGATESHRQLRKYDRWAERNSGGRQVFRLFLTPDGRAAESAEEEWTPMSFLDLACILRARCCELTSTPGYHFLRFYLAGVLRDICGWHLPIGDPESIQDPYDVTEYLEAVFPPQEATT